MRGTFGDILLVDVIMKQLVFNFPMDMLVAELSGLLFSLPQFQGQVPPTHPVPPYPISPLNEILTIKNGQTVSAHKYSLMENSLASTFCICLFSKKHADPARHRDALELIT